jgi:cell division protease FtsH
MSDKFGMMGLESRESMYLDNGTRLNCSEQMAAEVDREIMRILRESYEEAKRLLTENREALDKIAEYLIEKETITGKEFMRIFREVKGIPDPDAPKAEEVLEETASVEDVSSENITNSADTTTEEITTEEVTVQDML